MTTTKAKSQDKKMAEIDENISKLFDIKKRLGKGAYGIVWKAMDKRTNETLAVKKIFDAFRDETDAQRTFREIIFLKAFRTHPNVIKLNSVYKAANNLDIYLIFEFMESDLHNIIKKGSILKDIHKRYVMYQLINAIKYIHSGNVIHRDLKPSNVLIDSKCRCKLADFGLARSVSNKPQQDAQIDNAELRIGEPLLTDYVATRWYRAPEILVASKTYTKGIDMWSLGCILGEMIRGKPLFQGSSTVNQIEKIVTALPDITEHDISAVGAGFGSVLLSKEISNETKTSLSELLIDAPNDAVHLVKSLLILDPHGRLTAKQALAHPYVEKFRNSINETELNVDILPPFRDDIRLTVPEYRSKLYEIVQGGTMTANNASQQRSGGGGGGGGGSNNKLLTGGNLGVSVNYNYQQKEPLRSEHSKVKPSAGTTKSRPIPANNSYEDNRKAEPPRDYHPHPNVSDAEPLTNGSDANRAAVRRQSPVAKRRSSRARTNSVAPHMTTATTTTQAGGGGGSRRTASEDFLLSTTSIQQSLYDGYSRISAPRSKMTAAAAAGTATTPAEEVLRSSATLYASYERRQSIDCGYASLPRDAAETKAAEACAAPASPATKAAAAARRLYEQQQQAEHGGLKQQKSHSSLPRTAAGGDHDASHHHHQQQQQQQHRGSPSPRLNSRTSYRLNAMAGQGQHGDSMNNLHLRRGSRRLEASANGTPNYNQRMQRNSSLVSGRGASGLTGGGPAGGGYDSGFHSSSQTRFNGGGGLTQAHTNAGSLAPTVAASSSCGSVASSSNSSSGGGGGGGGGGAPKTNDRICYEQRLKKLEEEIERYKREVKSFCKDATIRQGNNNNNNNRKSTPHGLPCTTLITSELSKHNGNYANEPAHNKHTSRASSQPHHHHQQQQHSQHKTPNLPPVTPKQNGTSANVAATTLPPSRYFRLPTNPQQQRRQSSVGAINGGSGSGGGSGDHLGRSNEIVGAAETSSYNGHHGQHGHGQHAYHHHHSHAHQLAMQHQATPAYRYKPISKFITQ